MYDAIRFSALGESFVRTTLTIDDDILAAARDLAEFQQKTIGEVLSSLVRKGLQLTVSVETTRYGVPQLPIQPGSGPVSLEIVNRLRDEFL
jgi:hypothetical protein